MSKLCFFLFLLLLLLSGTTFSEGDDTAGHVLELTDANFDAAISNHDHILVDFYAPWCGHCKRLSPELDAAAPGLAEKTPPIVLAKVNVDKNSKLASKYRISGYPTLKFFIKGFPTDYKGPRKAALLSSHLQKLAHPDVEVFTSEVELENFLQIRDTSFPIFMCFGMQGSGISDLAKQFKSKAWFTVLENFSEKTMEKFDFDKGPAIVVRSVQGEEEVYYGPFTGDDLSHFVRQNLLPRVNEVTQDNLQSLRGDGRLIALTILRDDSSIQSINFLRKLKAAAPANRQFIFAYLDSLKWPSFADTFHIDKQRTLPVFIIWDGHSSYFESVEGYDFGGERAESYITLFLQEFKEGKAKRTNVKGPNFKEFLGSLLTIRSLHLVLLIVSILSFAWIVWGSVETSDVRKGEMGDSEISDIKPAISASSHSMKED